MPGEFLIGQKWENECVVTRNIREANGMEKKTRRSPMEFLATTKPKIVGGGIGILRR